MILGIDTSIGTAVAVVEADGVVRSAAKSDETMRHAEVIGDLLVAALAEADITPADITQVAAGMGPGPFTGLRIGVAAARAFALARGIPLVPVVSHDAIALEVLLHDAMADTETPRFAVVTDARRREFAYSIYDGLDDDGLPMRAAEPALVPRDELGSRLAAAHVTRYPGTTVPGPMVALLAARASGARRAIGPAAPLYLRSPDVTLPAAPKRVTA